MGKGLEERDGGHRWNSFPVKGSGRLGNSCTHIGRKGGGCPFKCISGAVWSQCHLHQLPLPCGLLNWRGACIDWGFLKLSFILQMFIEHLLCSKPCHRYRGCGEKFSILKGFTVEERSSTSSDPHFVTITNLLTFKGWGGEKN